jgi:eukaryotic-like serine/threonine-protein kinase
VTNEETIFAEALGKRSVPDRDAYLDHACAGDVELRQAVDALLLAHQKARGILEVPPVDLDATREIRPSSEPVGSTVGPYKILQQIGEGGMAVVFLAEQTRPIQRKVALKIIKPGMDSRQVIARFEAERQALAVMDHANIAKVLEAGTTDSGRPYFVMELVKGVPITTYCDEHHLTPRDRLELFVRDCSAVQHAHTKGIIHRDLKPSNVLVALYDGKPVPKVIDFGIAKATGQPLTERTLFTTFGSVVGTPSYMSPEQAELNQLDVDTRSDIYSLGVLLYELLTGSTPLEHDRFRAAALLEMLRVVREEEPPKPSTRLSTSEGLPGIAANRGLEPKKLSALVHGELDWIVMKALEKDRSRRYETANGFAMDVQRYLDDETVQACPPSARYRLGKFVRRHRPELLVAGVMIFLIIAGALASGVGFFRAARAERAARRDRDVATGERDRAVTAEAQTQEQKQRAEAEARRAEVQFADSLINQGDALVSAAEFPDAYARFAEAATQLRALGTSLGRLDLSLVRLYRASPPPLWSITLPGGVTSAFAVLPARQEFIASCSDGRFRVYDLLSGAELRSFAAPAGIRRIEVAASPDGPIIIAMGADSGAFSIRVINPDGGGILRRVEDDRATEFCVVSPDGALAASGNQTGMVTFWETATLEKLGSGKHGPRVAHAAFSHEGATVATVGEDNIIALWDPKTGRELRRLSGRPNSGITRVSFSGDDRVLICGESDGAISAVSLDGKILTTWPAHRGYHSIRSLLVTSEGERVITSGEDGRVRVFDSSRTGAWEATLTMAPADQARVFGALFIADSGPKACAATCGLPAVDQGVIVALTEHSQVIAWPLVGPHRFKERLERAISMSADGMLCAGHVTDRVEVRDSITGRTLRVLPQITGCRATAFSPDAGLLFVGNDDGTLAALDLGRGEYRWVVHAHDGQICSIDVSSDGSVVASAGGEGATRIWETATGTLVGALRHQGGYGTAAVFAPARTGPTSKTTASTGNSLQRRRLIIGGGDQGTVYDWDVAGDSPPKRVYAAGPIRGVTLSPNGKLLAIATGAHRATLLDPVTLDNVGFLGPVHSVMYQVRFINLGSATGAWALACAGRELRAWDMSTRHEQLVLDSTFDERAITNTDTSNYAINTLAASDDGTSAMAKGIGRLDFTLPRRYRELQRDASPVARAEWYAQWGLWAWTRAVLQREQAAGREVPAVLLARASWMCGDYEAARRAFDLAVTAREVPASYAALCLTVGDTPPTTAARASAARTPDPGARAAATAPLPKGVLAAADVGAIKAMTGQDIIVEGVVTDSAWSRTGKVMNIQFAGHGTPGLFCCVFQAKRAAFDAAFGGDAAAQFSGARIRLRGKLVVYAGFDPALKGWPEIILDDPQQVTIVQERPARGGLTVPTSVSEKPALP